ncbi:MAG: YihA family ribosome biogenesis GTP-binding protein, partial [Phascolarctobacterium sp.]|nr:YihA family ribosome biogenesis GTP-binding protein [Candidatus Phascolarctobacterium equi]
CYQWLKACGHNVLIVLTKMDKLSRNQINSQMALFRKKLGLGENDIICYSSLNNKQRGVMIDRLMREVMPGC